MLETILLAVPLLSAYTSYFTTKRFSEQVFDNKYFEVRFWKIEHSKELLNFTVSAPFLKPIVVLDKKLLKLPRFARNAILAHEIAHEILRSSDRILITTIAWLMIFTLLAYMGIHELFLTMYLLAFLVFLRWYRRSEEFRADELASQLVGRKNMIKAYLFLVAGKPKARSLLISFLKLLGNPTPEERVAHLLTRAECIYELLDAQDGSN